MISNRASFRKLTSNSQTTVSQMNNIKRNRKGHPTVGMLTLQRKPHVCCYIDRCFTLQSTADMLNELYTIENNHKDVESWRSDVFKKLFVFVNRCMVPTFDDIDDMLLVCRVLLENKKKFEFQEFILNCPKKFIIAYSNNSERTPTVLHKLERMGLNNIRSYLIEHVDDSKLATWRDRYNSNQNKKNLRTCSCVTLYI